MRLPDETHHNRTAAGAVLSGAAAAIAFVLPLSVYAQEEVRLPPTVVTGTRVEQPAFDLPMSIDSVEREQIQEQQLQVNVSENLVRVPGTVVQNRQTYAQELQISLRGFGARSQFGVRGIRLIADGIPASTPDGQGGSGLFALSSAARIEVLRGPFSALYGNHSGGVIQIFTEDGPEVPTLTPSAAFGSYDTSRYGLKFGGDTGGFNYIFDTSAFETDGYREHSAASRDHLNSKFRWSLDGGSTLTLVANAFDQPNNQDPLGLNAAQVAENRRQARSPRAFTFNTRRNLDNAQTGLVYERPMGSNDTLRLLSYVGQRNNEQFLPFRGDADPTDAGGVSVIERDFGGLGARWTHRTTGEAPLTVTTGVDYDIAKDARTGFVNDNGVRGELRRDEDNTVDSWGAYVQTEKWLTPKWSVSGGLRYTEVNFESEDHFIVTGNPDDSGTASHDAWTPVVGALYRVSPALNLYANAGRSFETPTFIEIAFRPTGTGLNLDLQPSTSNHYEVGLKAFAGADTRINLALFAIDTEDEIVVGVNNLGRATFRNAGDTERRGVELLVDSNLGGGFTTYFAYTYIDAIFADSFVTPGGDTVQSGNQIPAVPRNMLYGEVAWRHRPSGFSTAVEARWHDKVYVDDLNSEFAPSYTVANLRAGFEQNIGDWRFTEFARVDNVFDKEYIGAVIVNDDNGNFYAPAPTRNYLVGFAVARAF